VNGIDEMGCSKTGWQTSYCIGVGKEERSLGKEFGKKERVSITPNTSTHPWNGNDELKKGPFLPPLQALALFRRGDIT
jgi:hypothetical protein